VAHPGHQQTDQPIANPEEKSGFDKALNSGVSRQIIRSDFIKGEEVFSVCSRIVVGNTGTPWVFQANIPVSTILKPVTQVRNTIFLVAFLLMLIASMGLYLLLRSIVLTPLHRVEQYAGAVSSGDESKLPQYLGRFHGEFRRVMSSIEKMVALLKSRYDELKDKTKQLQESEQRMRLVFHQSPLAVIEWDAHSRVSRWNPAAEKIFGYSAQEAIGKYGSFILSRIENKDGVLSRRQFLAWQDLNGNGVYNLTNDGNTLICDWYSVPLIESGGEVVGAVSLGLDVTQHKLLEDQLRQAQKMEAIGTLAGGIAHDFNNILGAIYGYTELSLESDPPLRTEISDNLNQILKAAQRAKSLVRQILTFSRQSESIKQPIEINLLTDETIKLLRASIPTTIKMNYQKSARPVSVLADPTQIHQVLMNLCTNAAYAMKETGGVLTIVLTEEYVNSQEILVIDKDLPQGMYARLTVKDTGKGISPEHLSRIFEPFFTTKTTGEGTGLGLAVALGIIKSHGGAIRVSSSSGEGATFDVYLPALKDVQESPESTDRHAHPQGTGERILLVDDDVDFGQVHKKILEKLGYSVIFKNDSTSALELFQSQPEAIDLVLSDQTMPGLTGIRMVTEMIKIRPDLPILLCSGYSDAVTAEEIKVCGIREYLYKPFKTERLAATIHLALQNKASNKPDTPSVR